MGNNAKHLTPSPIRWNSPPRSSRVSMLRITRGPRQFLSQFLLGIPGQRLLGCSSSPNPVPDGLDSTWKGS
ncbi:hypothetical protein IG631_18134 [Alternaria alternata]|nr:hypothetical protein IG631_18134 [Alternaria alternata]